MLPSMPSLTPCKDESRNTLLNIHPEKCIKAPPPEVIQPKEDKPVVSIVNSIPIKANICEESDDGEEVNEYKKYKARTPKSSLAKKRKQRDIRQTQITRDMLSIETDENDDINYASSYYDRVAERLTPELLQSFREILLLINTGEDPSKVYKMLESLLLPDYHDLLDQFLTFLSPKQAAKIGKFMEYFLATNMDKFVQMCQVYFSKQPGQMKKLCAALSDLSNNPTVTMDKVKNTILPLIRENKVLTDWFLQLFPTEKPQESDLNDFERIDFDKMDASNMYDNIVIPEVHDDPYGGDNCICNCHDSEDVKYKTRYLHCIPCGMKYIQGRVYVQTGKRVRPATVTFEGPISMKEHIKRLSAKPKVIKRRADTSPTKLLSSPNKSCSSEEHRSELATDTDEDTKKSPRKNSKSLQNKCKSKQLVDSTKICTVVLKEEEFPKFPKEKESKDTASISKLPDPIPMTIIENQVSEPTETEVILTPDNTDNAMQALIASEELNISLESDDKMSNVSVGSSDSSICSDSDVSVHSEKSDVINSDSEGAPVDTEDNTNDSMVNKIESALGCVSDHKEQNLKNTSDPSKTSISETVEDVDSIPWTREEDKIVLQTFQAESDFDSTVIKICELLPHKSLSEIKNRFRILLNLLQKITSQE